MAPKNSQNKPPIPSAPSSSTSPNSKYSIDEVFLEKKRKIGNIKMPSANISSRTTKSPALAERNGGGDLPICSGQLSTAGSDCGRIEFTKESIEALLNEGSKIKNMRLNYKERCGRMMDYIKRLKDCIKWFQPLEGSYVAELEKLKDLLEAAEKKCNNIEMKAKEDELNSIIMELRKNYDASQEKLEKTENDKLEALDSYTREKEARAAAERLQTSLSKDLNRAQTDIASGNQKIQSLNDMCKRLQEHNTSLQQYNSKLQSELATANETLKRVEKEKAVVAENLSTVWGHCTSLQEQLTSSRVSIHLNLNS